MHRNKINPSSKNRMKWLTEIQLGIVLIFLIFLKPNHKCHHQLVFKNGITRPKRNIKLDQ